SCSRSALVEPVRSTQSTWQKPGRAERKRFAMGKGGGSIGDAVAEGVEFKAEKPERPSVSGHIVVKVYNIPSAIFPASMSARTEHTTFAGLAGDIDCAIDWPEGTPGGWALVLHPHPLHGGARDNKVVTTISRSCVQHG